MAKLWLKKKGRKENIQDQSHIELGSQTLQKLKDKIRNTKKQHMNKSKKIIEENGMREIRRTINIQTRVKGRQADIKEDTAGTTVMLKVIKVNQERPDKGQVIKQISNLKRRKHQDTVRAGSA